MDENNSTEKIGIFCPKCGGSLNSVYQTERRADVIFRRRKCLCCGKSFSTYECAENSAVLCLQIIPDASNHELLGNMITEKEIFEEFCEYMDTKDARYCTEAFKNIITSDEMKEYRISVSEVNEERFITNPSVIKNTFEVTLYLYGYKFFIKYMMKRTSAPSINEFLEEVKANIYDERFKSIQEKAISLGCFGKDATETDRNMFKSIVD